MRRLICWLKGHNWRYDGHVWGSGLAAHDLFVCGNCGSHHAEPAAAAAEAAA
jgi:hypothetical protein